MYFDLQLLFRLSFVLFPIALIPFSVIALIFGRDKKERQRTFILMCAGVLFIDFVITRSFV